MKKITFFWTKKPKKFHVDPSEEEENNMKKERKVIQEKKNPSEKKTLFSLNIVVKLKFFYHFKKIILSPGGRKYIKEIPREFFSPEKMFLLIVIKKNYIYFIFHGCKNTF